MSLKWDKRFLTLAEHVAPWSKDPSTKVGAVIIRPDRTVASIGFNGFPKGMSDSVELYEDRETKYDRVIHAEINAILNAMEPVCGYTLYTWPFFTCSRCSVHIIQAGISRVVSPKLPYGLLSRWGQSLSKAKQYYDEVGVIYSEVEI